MIQISIKQTVERMPGVITLVPLLLGPLIATLISWLSSHLRSFTNALFTGSLPILAVFFVCMGAPLVPYILNKGRVLFITKISVAAVVGVFTGRLLGECSVASGAFAGLSALALVTVFKRTSGRVCKTLMEQYDREGNVAAYSIMSLKSGPFLTMLTLEIAALFAFPSQTLAGLSAANTANNVTEICVAATFIASPLLVAMSLKSQQSVSIKVSDPHD